MLQKNANAAQYQPMVTTKRYRKGLDLEGGGELASRKLSQSPGMAPDSSSFVDTDKEELTGLINQNQAGWYLGWIS